MGGAVISALYRRVATKRFDQQTRLDIIDQPKQMKPCNLVDGFGNTQLKGRQGSGGHGDMSHVYDKHTRSHPHAECLPVLGTFRFSFEKCRQKPRRFV